MGRFPVPILHVRKLYKGTWYRTTDMYLPEPTFVIDRDAGGPHSMHSTRLQAPPMNMISSQQPAVPCWSIAHAPRLPHARPLWILPFPTPILLVNAAAEGFADESATFVRGAQISANKVRDWLASGLVSGQWLCRQSLVSYSYKPTNAPRVSVRARDAPALILVPVPGSGTCTSTCIMVHSMYHTLVLRVSATEQNYGPPRHDARPRVGGGATKVAESASHPLSGQGCDTCSYRQKEAGGGRAGGLARQGQGVQ